MQIACRPGQSRFHTADFFRRSPVSCPCPLSYRFARLIEIVQVFVFFGFDIDPSHRMVRATSST